MERMNFTPIREIVTQRLRLQKLRIEDDIDLIRLRSDESVNKYIKRPKYGTIHEARAFIEKINNGVERGDWFYWRISLKDSEELIGTICLWNIKFEKRTCEVGFELFPAYQGKGLMKEALKEVLEFGFRKMGLQKIHGVANKNNENSIKLMENFNFIRDPDAESSLEWIENEAGEMVVYSLSVKS